MRARESATKQLKDAGSLNSSAIQATEDAEMRCVAGFRSRADPPDARPSYQMKMSSPMKIRL